MAKEIGFFVQGADAALAADEIKKIIREELGFESRITPAPRQQADDIKMIDPATGVALAALILAIPGTVLAVLDIKDRLSQKKKLDAALTEIDQKVIRKHKVAVKVIYPDGTVKETRVVDTVELLERVNSDE